MGFLDSEKGYTKGWVEKDDTMKEYRQLAFPFSPQPDFILRLPNMDAAEADEGLRPGITFIVLDIDAAGKLQVRCPPYGFNKGVHTNNDVAFLLHHHSGVWEPIFHVSKGRYTLFFQQGWKKDSRWPKIVEERKREFESICVTDSTLSYAARQVSKKMLVSASILHEQAEPRMKRLNSTVFYVIPYNHLAALVFKTTAGLISVPCIDDGYLFPASTLYLDWTDLYPTAPPKEILQFYETHITNEKEFQDTEG
jgi:hypothetical protein